MKSKESKGISPLIAAIILILFIILIGFLTSNFFKGLTVEQKEKIQVVGEKTFECSQAVIRIDEVRVREGYPVDITLENIGKRDLSDLKMIIYNSSGVFNFNITRNSISSGSKLTISSTENVGKRNEIEAMLVIDRSGSMDDDGLETEPGVCYNQYQPMCDTKEAAKSFVDRLNSSKDRSSLVSFATFATLDQGLTFVQQDVKDAIDALVPTGWTAIGDAINLANNELVNNGRENTILIQVLLSDGHSNVGSDPITRANEAAGNNIVIYTIGLGSNADNSTLQEIADITGGSYHYAPTSDDLQQIYDDISEEITHLAEAINKIKITTECSNVDVTAEKIRGEWKMVMR